MIGLREEDVLRGTGVAVEGVGASCASALSASKAEEG